MQFWVFQTPIKCKDLTQFILYIRVFAQNCKISLQNSDSYRIPNLLQIYSIFGIYADANKRYKFQNCCRHSS